MLNSKQIHSFAFFLGVTAITTQVVLMREFYSIFYGNELCFGLLLAVWLLWVAIGSFLSTRIRNDFFTPALLFYLQFLFFISTIVSLILIKSVRTLMNIPFGEYIALDQMFWFSLWVLAVPCILIGVQFTLLTGMKTGNDVTAGSNASAVYVYEAFGSALAGLLTGLILFRFLSNLYVVLIVFGLVFLGIYVSSRLKITLLVSFFLFVLFFTRLPEQFYQYLMQNYWQSFGNEMQYIDGRQTRYGELSIVDWGGANYLYVNGNKSTQLSDRITTQEQAALIMAQHPNPECVLLIGGGLGGLAGELGRYLQCQTTYVEQNQKALELVKMYTDSIGVSNMDPSGLNFIFNDGRRFLQTTQSKFDIIIINVGKPSTGESNRYYTREFFSVIEKRISSGGIFVIAGFPAGENYMGPELLQLNAGIYQDLMSVFEDVLVIPGDNAMYFNSNQGGVLLRDPEILTRRYNQLGIKHEYFYATMFRQYMLSHRLKTLKDLLQSTAVARQNHDYNPIAYYYDFVLWNKLLKTETDRLKGLLSLSFKDFLLITSFMLTIVFTLLFGLRKKESLYRTGLSGMLIIYIGYAGMTLNVLLIFAFQVLYGYIYEWIGLVLGVFMLGMALSAWWMQKQNGQDESKKLLNLYFFLLILLIGFLWPIIQGLHHYNAPILYLILVFAAGSLTGGMFPLMCHRYALKSESKTGGYFYAADVLGGALGAITVSGILYPLYGFFHTTLVLLLGGTVSFFMFYIDQIFLYKKGENSI